MIPGMSFVKFPTEKGGQKEGDIGQVQNVL